MGKGKRTRATRTSRRAWSARGAGRDAVRWRDLLRTFIDETRGEHDPDFQEHMQRLRHTLTAAKDAQDLDEVESIWLAFTRPIIRQGFAAGLDITGIDWRQDPGKDNSQAIMRFTLSAINADRNGDQAALHGPVYVISPQVHVVIAACAATLSPREVGQAFVFDDLPATSGFLALPDQAPWVSMPYTRAMTWHRLRQATWDEDHVVPSMRFKGYMHTTGAHHLKTRGLKLAVTDTNAVTYNMQRDVMLCLGDLPPDDIEQFLAFLDEGIAERRSLDETIERADQIAADAAGDIGEARLDRDFDRPLVLSAYFAAFIRLLDQEIIGADGQSDEAESVTPSTTARSTDHMSDDLQILRLRRAPAEATTNRDGAVRWSHRWIVQMHKVRQWYPSENRHKIIWRGPYVKGPPGAPLKEPREVVHAVIR